ncbi:MAG: TlpA disulfide reductase family protein [Acidimicrobiia bacterium]
MADLGRRRRRRRSSYGLPVASGGSDDSSKASKSSGTETAPVTVSGTKLPAFTDASTDLAVGETMPTLTGKSLSGGGVEVAPNGNPQMLVFVAHWCPHCQAEVPRIVTLANDGVFDGVDVTAIATGTNSGYPNYPPSSWLEREKWPFDVMADSTTFTAAKAYGLASYPYIVFVDKDGKIAGCTSGEIAPADLTKMVEVIKAGEPIPGCRLGARPRRRTEASAAVAAEADEVDAVVLRGEARRAGDLQGRRGERLLHPADAGTSSTRPHLVQIVRWW